MKNYDNAKPNKRGNGRANSTQGKGKERKKKVPFDKETTASATNDPSWYVKNTALLKDVASLPFSNMLGSEVEKFKRLVGQGSALVANATVKDTVYTVPGIAVLSVDPCLGGGSEATDAPTVSARMNYTFVRHANSGSVNYESPDMQMMCCSHYAAQAWLTSLERLYAALRTYATRNRYYAEALVHALGFDYDDMLKHIVDLRTYIDMCRMRLNTIKVPAPTGILSRWTWLNSNIFVDDEDANKAQTYLVKFRVWPIFDGYSSEAGTSLVYDFPAGYQDVIGSTTFDGVVTFTEKMLKPLLSEEDVGIMSGDIMKAYGESVSQLAAVAEDATLQPLYDKTFLQQILNAEIAPVPGLITSNAAGTIYQENGVIIDSHYTNGSADRESLILNSITSSTSAEDCIEMTRFCHGTVEEQDSGEYRLKDCGTEIPRSLAIISMVDGEPSYSSLTRSTTLLLNKPLETNTPLYKFITDISVFDYHPTFILAEYNEQAKSITGIGILGEMQNFSVLARENIARMNRVAVLGELDML